MRLERPFDHRRAQEYEIEFGERLIKENFENLWAEIEATKAQGDWWPGHGELEINGFYAGQSKQWRELAAHVEGKTCLEIGPGPLAALVAWWWVRRRIFIDPLTEEYKRISLKHFKRTWYTDDLELCAQPAEDLIPELLGAIDGAIICRNVLDHRADPMLVLENVAAYAAPGCYLLLWTDLWHLRGHDEGHRNITKDNEGFEKRIRDLGFEILYSFDGVRQDSSTIDYGYRARKAVVANRK